MWSNLRLAAAPSILILAVMVAPAAQAYVVAQAWSDSDECKLVLGSSVCSIDGEFILWVWDCNAPGGTYASCTIYISCNVPGGVSNSVPVHVIYGCGDLDVFQCDFLTPGAWSGCDGHSFYTSGYSASVTAGSCQVYDFLIEVLPLAVSDDARLSKRFNVCLDATSGPTIL